MSRLCRQSERREASRWKQLRQSYWKLHSVKYELLSLFLISHESKRVRRSSWWPLLLLLSLWSLNLRSGSAQANLSARQIAEGEALGRTTFHSLKFGTFASVKGENLHVFVLSPVQRIAYTTSEESNTHHRDILKDEIHLNRLRVSVIGYGQHHSRGVVLYDYKSKKKLEPAHLVLDLDEVIAEFSMPAVVALGAPSGTILIQIADETGTKHPAIPFNLKLLHKRYQKFDNEYFE